MFCFKYFRRPRKKIAQYLLIYEYIHIFECYGFFGCPTRKWTIHFFFNMEPREQASLLLWSFMNRKISSKSSARSVGSSPSPKQWMKKIMNKMAKYYYHHCEKQTKRISNSESPSHSVAQIAHKHTYAPATLLEASSSHFQYDEQNKKTQKFSWTSFFFLHFSQIFKIIIFRHRKSCYYYLFYFTKIQMNVCVYLWNNNNNDC